MKLTLDTMLNSINKWRINVELNNKNYTKAEKNPVLKDYLLDLYDKKGLNDLASYFLNHSI